MQAVEAASGQEFKASVLGAYERGERAISVPRLQRLARFYNVPLDQLLPRGAGPEGGGLEAIGTRLDLLAAEAELEQGADEGWASPWEPEQSVCIDLVRLGHADLPERELINRYLGSIQLQRGDFNGRVLSIRRDDLRAVACILDTTPQGARRRLGELGLLAQT